MIRKFLQRDQTEGGNAELGEQSHRGQDMKNSLNLVIIMSVMMMLAAMSCCGSATPVRHDFPRVGPYEVITGDFHMHTKHSDGKLSTRERVEESFRWGYDAIAVTDHGKLDGYRVARYVGEPLGMIIIPGFETGLSGKEHLVALNVPADHPIRDAHHWAESAGQAKAFYQEELKKIADAGGLVIYAHPHVGYREPVIWGIEQGIIQGIEYKNGVVGTGWNTTESHGTWWYPEAVDFALKHNLAIFGNSDVHANRAPDTSPVTLLLVTERTNKGVIDAIKARRTAAWFNGMLWGRKDLLTDILQSSVVAKSQAGKIEIENLSPIGLTGAAGSEKIDLKPYAKITINDTAKSVSIAWDNVWLDLKTNLTTQHKVQ